MATCRRPAVANVRATAATTARVEETYRAKGAEIDHLDGVTIGFPAWWFNLRPSNTQPLLRLNVEADDPETLNLKTKEVLSLIRPEPPAKSAVV